MDKLDKPMYWNKNPEALQHLVTWYPHYGSSLISKELKCSQKSVKDKANRLKLKCVPRNQRICCSCKVEKVHPLVCYGYFCKPCFNKKKNAYNRVKMRDNPLKGRLTSLLRSLKCREKSTNLTIDDLYQAWETQKGICVYSGRKMFLSPNMDGTRTFDSASVDRIDSSKGYTKNNIVLCTWWSNAAKSNASVKEFIERCKEIANYGS